MASIQSKVGINNRRKRENTFSFSKSIVSLFIYNRFSYILYSNNANKQNTNLIQNLQQVRPILV